MGVLEKLSREYLTFDPENVQHRAAYWHLRSTGRQLDKLRFSVEEGFSSVITMMQTKLADHCCRPATQEQSVVREIKPGKKL